MNLVKRLFTSVVLLGATAWILLKGSAFVFTLEVIAFVAAALFEFFTLLKKADVPVYRLFGVALGVVIPMLVYMELGTTSSGDVLFIVLGCLFLFIMQFFHKDHPQALVGICLTLFGILYISWFLSFTIKIRFMEGGVMWLVYLVAVTKAADVGAYVVGTTLGRHQLVPHISPKKSVEGLFGGLAFSILASLAFRDLLPIDFSLFHWTLMGLLIGGIGQVGDLSESLMKRFCKAKDSGDWLPGMGGVLDSVDSILFTAPILYFHLKVYA